MRYFQKGRARGNCLTRLTYIQTTTDKDPKQKFKNTDFLYRIKNGK